MNKTLLKQTIKENWGSWAIYTGIQCLLLFVMGGTAPIAAAGLAYYNMMPLLLVAIYVITVGTKLLASKVDSGSMAYVLSTPNTRIKVATTQIIFFIGSLALMFILAATSHIISASISKFGCNGAEVWTIVKLNMGLFALSILFSGITFLFSSIFNLAKHSTAVGGGIVGLFVLLPIVAMFGSDFAWLKNITPTTLYAVPELMTIGSDFIWKFAILVGIGIICYIGSVFTFNKRDLPL
jgi:ABC-2 type transport system permease protein